MGRSRVAGTRIEDALLLSRNTLGVAVLALSGTTQLAAGMPHVLMLDPSGSARTVKLPASPKKGDWFLIVNTADAAEVITVQDSAAAGLTPACTPTQSESALIIYSGDATLGWRSMVMLGA